MDKDEYAVLRARIQKKAEEDVAALDRAWELMNGFFSSSKAKSKTNGHNVLTKQFLSAAPAHPTIFTVDDMLKKFPSMERRKAIDILNRLKLMGRLEVIKKGTSGKNGTKAEYQVLSKDS